MSQREDISSNIAETAARLAAARGEFTVAHVAVPGLDAEVPLVGRFDGQGVGLVDIKAESEKWRDQPARRKGVARAATLESFIALCQRHCDADSAIFAEVTNQPRLTAVFDYHRANEGCEDNPARFCQHRCVYEFPLSREWEIWSGVDGKTMKQGEFAAFIEDHIVDVSGLRTDDEIAGPLAAYLFASPAELMELSRGLEIAAQARVRTIVNLQSGAAQIAFEEEHKDATGRPLQVAGAFMLAIPMFDGGEVTRIPCRLRYRKQDGGLTWSIHMFRAGAIMRQRVIDDMRAASDATGLPAYIGAPEA